MSVDIALNRWTDQGLRTVKDTVGRAREAIAAVAKLGGKMTIYWTQGQYDFISIVEGNVDNEASTALLFNIYKAGNVRSESLRAYTLDEMERIVKKVQ